MAEAKTAAATLGIPVHVIDAGDVFEREVVVPFCENYCDGRTPNPCILCNPAVKFRMLAEQADTLASGTFPPAIMPALSVAPTASAACAPRRVPPGIRPTCSTD